MESSESSNPKPERHFGLIALMVAVAASLGIIAWGLGTSAPVSTATAEIVDPQYGTVEVGSLVESARVLGTVSLGEIVALSVPEAERSTVEPVAVDPAVTDSVDPTALSSNETDAAASSVNDATRVLTSVAPVGTILEAGDAAFVVDDRPTTLLYGVVPAWRDIDTSTSAGVDIEQLENYLAGAGLESSGDIEVDEEMDESTVTAIEEWQESAGLDPTGSLAFGEIAFVTGPVTVVALGAEVGDVVSAGESIVEVRTGEPFVDVSTDASWASVGDELDVDLGRSNVVGTVTSFNSGIARISLPSGTTLSDGATVAVNVTRVSISDQLLVPSSAILQTDLDGPTVTLEGDDGSRVVAVEVLASSSSQVAVKPAAGGMNEGDSVRRY